jgi:hypothetical protein
MVVVGDCGWWVMDMGITRMFGEGVALDAGLMFGVGCFFKWEGCGWNLDVEACGAMHVKRSNRYSTKKASWTSLKSMSEREMHGKTGTNRHSHPMAGERFGS